MPTIYGLLKIATFVAQTAVFGQMVIFSKYVLFPSSVHNFKTIHHKNKNLVPKLPLGTWLCIQGKKLQKVGLKT